MAKYRMYSLVLRQLNPIQKGVQSTHSIVEYALKHHKRTEFIQWSNVDKTVIILDGGTYPEMKECRKILDDLNVPYAAFYEEDLNDLMTSISFIAEDKVWDCVAYPALEDIHTFMPFIGSHFEEETSESDTPEWLTEMGGIENLRLRNFIFSKKLSQ